MAKPIRQSDQQPRAHTQDGQPLTPPTPAQSNTDPSRRSILKAGLIGVPMMITFSSRSAWAAASGNASGMYGGGAVGGAGTTDTSSGDVGSDWDWTPSPEWSISPTSPYGDSTGSRIIRQSREIRGN